MLSFMCVSIESVINQPCSNSTTERISLRIHYTDVVDTFRVRVVREFEVDRAFQTSYNMYVVVIMQYYC
jgi:hypothetical protein